MHASAWKDVDKFAEFATANYSPRERAADAIPAVLDVGSRVANNQRSPRDFFEDAGWVYTGLDIEDGPNVDVVNDFPPYLPFDDGEFAGAISISTFEHDQQFWATFAEMVRVVDVGGYIYLNAPSAGHYHAHPIDCWRFLADAWPVLGGCTDGVVLLNHYIIEESSWRDNVGIFQVGWNEIVTTTAPPGT